jgi:hypothetical protein
MSFKKTIWLIFAIAIFSIQGCKKTYLDNINNKQVPESLLIKKANEWLDKMEKIAAISDKPSLSSLRDNLTYSDITIQRLDANYQLLVIPVSNEFTSNMISKNETKKYLVIKCNKYTAKGGYFLEISTKNSISSKNQQLQFKNFFNAVDSDFDGQVAFSTIYQKFLFEQEYTNGKLSKTKFLFPEKKNTIKIKNSSIESNNVNCIDWYWMYYLNGVLIGEVYAFTTCERNPNCLPQTTEIGNNRSIVIKASCIDNGGEPGNAGGEVLVDTIKNNLITPCFVATFNKLFVNSTITTNRLSGFLTHTFGLNTKFKLSVNEVPTLAPQPGSPAGTIVYASIDTSLGIVRTEDGGLDITVNLNKSTLQNASQELVAMSILHEATHGYLAAQGIMFNMQHHWMYFLKLQNEMATIVYELYKDDTSNSLESLNALASDAIHSNPQSLSTQQYATGTRGKKCQ